MRRTCDHCGAYGGYDHDGEFWHHDPDDAEFCRLIRDAVSLPVPRDTTTAAKEQ